MLSRHEIELILGKQAFENLSCYPDFMRQPMLLHKQGKWVCQRCQNSEQENFASLGQSQTTGEPLVYCLNCLNMGRMLAGDELYYLPTRHRELIQSPGPCLTWSGKLSAEQERASKELCASLSDSSRPHLVHAVTGAGKTEMIFPVIEQVLREGGRVCLASPRIDVCLELYPRLQQAFEDIRIGLLYGDGEPLNQYCSLIIATSHQLLRFKAAFDLLIIDEVDAFPYVNDPSLHFAARRAVIAQTGKLIYLTATPDDSLLQLLEQGEITQTCLPARFHGFSLPVPKFIWLGNWKKQIAERNQKGRLYRHLREFMAGQGVRLIFMPSIHLAEDLYDWLRHQEGFQGLACVHAQDPKRKEKVNQVRQGRIRALISTTILERGVTFTNCHVTIIGAEDVKYTRSALVQMSGRVGRRKEFPSGQLYYAHYGKSRCMMEAKQEIVAMNDLARKRGLIHD